MVYLKRLSLEDSCEIYKMLQEIAPDDNGFHNKANGMSFEQFEEWLKKELSVDNGCLEGWMVPQSSYWLYDGDRPVGYGRLRHFLNDSLKETGGHIGYAIRSSERGKGYGNKILALLLDECKKINIDTVQISANTDNIPSNKVIRNNGGVLIRTSMGKNFYNIDLT